MKPTLPAHAVPDANGFLEWHGQTFVQFGGANKLHIANDWNFPLCGAFSPQPMNHPEYACGRKWPVCIACRRIFAENNSNDN